MFQTCFSIMLKICVAIVISTIRTCIEHVKYYNDFNNNMGRNPNVDIERSQYDTLSKFCNESGSSLKQMTNNLIRDFVHRRNLAADFSKELTFVGISSNRLTLRDQETSELVDVYYEKKLLFCSKDKSNFCKHTYYTLLLPELEQLEKIDLGLI